jgi:uncharacterized protein YndB with AHSA1/START domain
MKRLGEISPCYTMRFDRETRQSAARLWRAITQPDELVQWMGMPSARVELQVGGAYFVEFPPHVDDALDGVIVRMEQERHLAYVWRNTVVEWIIEEAGEGCRYTFTHHGQPPGLVPDEAGIAAGWHEWFDLLASHLEDEISEKDRIDPVELLAYYGKRIDRVLDTSPGAAGSA